MDQQNAEKLRLNVQLCYLTITQAIPTAINEIIFAAYIVKYDRAFETGLSAILADLTLEEAMGELLSSNMQDYLIFFLHISNDLAHCFHFYLYVTFSRRFREGFLERLGKMTSLVGP